MKKLMILAVAAIALAACSRTFEHHKAEPTQIGFGTWTEQLTKARVAGTSTFDNGDDFAVYGTKRRDSGDPTSQTVFNGDVVTKSSTGWDYLNHRYWDVNYAAYDFFAVSPATLAGTVDAATGEITTTVDFDGNNNDILVATKKTVNKTDTPVNFGNGIAAYGPVEIVFNHAASLVDVYVKKAPVLHDDAVTVSAFSLDNIKSAGSLHVDTYTPVPTIEVANWTPTANATDTYEPGDGADQVDISSAITIGEDTAFNPDQTTANTYTGAVTPLIKQLVVMPQTFVEPAAADRLTQEAAAANTTAQKITITYTIGSNPATTATLWLYDFDHIDNTEQAADYVGSWAPGKHYKFYITILANAISFTATINDWDATTIYGYNYLVK